MKIKTKSASLKLLGIVVTIAGFGVTLVTDWVESRALEERIDEGIDKALAKKSEQES